MSSITGTAGAPDYGMLARPDRDMPRRCVISSIALPARPAPSWISDSYAGLGTGASISLDLRPQMASPTPFSTTSTPPPDVCQ